MKLLELSVLIFVCRPGTAWYTKKALRHSLKGIFTKHYLDYLVVFFFGDFSWNETRNIKPSQRIWIYKSYLTYSKIVILWDVITRSWTQFVWKMTNKIYRASRRNVKWWKIAENRILSLAFNQYHWISKLLFSQYSVKIKITQKW